MLTFVTGNLPTTGMKTTWKTKTKAPNPTPHLLDPGLAISIFLPCIHAPLPPHVQVRVDCAHGVCIQGLSSFRLCMVIMVHQGPWEGKQGEMLASVLTLQ